MNERWSGRMGLWEIDMVFLGFGQKRLIFH